MSVSESQPRNKEIMRVFRDLDMVEHLGSGVARILEKYERDVFEIFPNFLRVVFRFVAPSEEDLEGTAPVTPEVIRLLAVIHGEVDRMSLQTALGLKAEKNFRILYLRPSIEGGYVEMTIPDKPNSRLQKYRLTEKGRDVLKRGFGE